MQPANCLNCGTALQVHDKFCPTCGQKADTRRISFSYLVSEFFRSFAHTDRGLFYLIKRLAINPGGAAADYAEGRRKRYFSPFAFLALCVGFSIFIYNMVKPYEDLPQPDYDDLARMPTEHLRELAVIAKERAISVQSFYNKNMNLISVLVAPYFAFMLWLFFRHRNRNMAEITLAYILFIGFCNILFAVFICPLMLIFNTPFSYNLLLWINMLLQTMYDAWGLKVFFRYKTAGGYIKVLSAMLLIGFIGFILVLIFLLFYIYNGSFDLLYYLSQPKTG